MVLSITIDIGKTAALRESLNGGREINQGLLSDVLVKLPHDAREVARPLLEVALACSSGRSIVYIMWVRPSR